MIATLSGRAAVAMLLGLLIAAELPAETVTYYATDHLGSPVAAMDADGNVLWRESYTPYGEKLENPSGAGNDTGYTGHQSDAVTGLTYMQARYYDPIIGRFMATDPVQFDGGNPMSFGRYLYVNGNPYRYVDPDGMEPTINMFPVNERIYWSAQKIADPPLGVISVAGHGTPRVMLRRFFQALDAPRLAETIRSEPEFKGASKVILLSCNVGRGDDSLAQKLANELGITVVAPNKFIFIDGEGNITVADPLPGTVNPENEFDLTNALPDPDNLGEFVEFHPNNE